MFAIVVHNEFLTSSKWNHGNHKSIPVLCIWMRILWLQMPIY